MFAHERHRSISDLVARKQRATVGDLQKALKISPATLRRDLSEMEKTGHLVRVHGGVVHPNALRGEPSFRHKRGEALSAKRAIARKAAELAGESGTVFIDAGTTCMEIARLLLPRKGIRIITNSVPVLFEAWKTGADVTALGGEIRTISGALTGAGAVEWARSLNADVAFIGASGADADGVSTTETAEAMVKQLFVARSRRSILVADARKWNVPATVSFAPWRAFDTWVTSSPLSPADASRVQKLGPKILRVSAEE